MKKVSDDFFVHLMYITHCKIEMFITTCSELQKIVFVVVPRSDDVEGHGH